MKKFKVQSLNAARVASQHDWCTKVSRDFDGDQIHDMYYEILDIMCESLGVTFNAQDLIKEMNSRGFNYVRAVLSNSADTLLVVVYKEPVGFDKRKPTVPENFDTDSETEWEEKFWTPLESFIEAKGFEILAAQETSHDKGSMRVEFKLARGPMATQSYKKIVRYLDYLSENDLIPGAYYSGSFYDRLSTLK